VAALIAARRAGDGIPYAVSCRALGVSRSWFYKWKGGQLPPRAARRERLKAEVARLFGLHQGKYGSPRITADLKDAGWRVSENTVAALMREQGLAARSRHRRRGTTRPGKGRWRAPDLVKRDFPAKEVNKKWYGDGTEIPTGQGKLYLASVLDMASRRVLGFTLGEHHDAQLAYGALMMAVAVRGGQAPGVVFHTDQGGEYTAGLVRRACVCERHHRDPPRLGKLVLLCRLLKRGATSGQIFRQHYRMELHRCTHKEERLGDGGYLGCVFNIDHKVATPSPVHLAQIGSLWFDVTQNRLQCFFELAGFDEGIGRLSRQFDFQNKAHSLLL